jgi:hypothetical protein
MHINESSRSTVDERKSLCERMIRQREGNTFMTKRSVINHLKYVPNTAPCFGVAAVREVVMT